MNKYSFVLVLDVRFQSSLLQGFRVSAEQQIASALLSEDQLDLEMIRDAASNIFYQYLSEKASPRVKCSDNARKKIWSTIQGSSLSDTVFDEIQQQVRFRE